jgi:hypothetical protein
MVGKDGRERQLIRSVCCWLLNVNNKARGTAYLASTAVHGAQVVGGMQKNHTTRVKRPLGLWTRPQRGQGEGKGVEEQNFPGLRAFRGDKLRSATCLIARVQVWCWPCVVEQHYVTPRSVQLTQNRTGATEVTMRTNTNSQRSKLAEASQEGERVV